MIFLAVAEPTPGRSSSSFSDAVLMLTGPLAAGAADAAEEEELFFDFDELDFSALSEAEDFDFADDSLDAALVLLTVTWDLILSTVLLGTPAFSRSETFEYGRPAMIFFA